MPNQMTGRIAQIGPPETLPAQGGREALERRTLLLDCSRTDPWTGQRLRDNYPLFEFIGERCRLLDGLAEGQTVTVSFSLQGAFYTGRDGQRHHFNRVRGYAIAPYAPTQGAAPPAPRPAPPPPAAAYAAEPPRQAPPPPYPRGGVQGSMFPPQQRPPHAEDTAPY